MTISAEQYNEACELWLRGWDSKQIAFVLRVPESEIWMITKPKPKVVKFPERKK